MSITQTLLVEFNFQSKVPLADEAQWGNSILDLNTLPSQRVLRGKSSSNCLFQSHGPEKLHLLFWESVSNFY